MPVELLRMLPVFRRGGGALSSRPGSLLLLFLPLVLAACGEELEQPREIKFGYVISDSGVTGAEGVDSGGRAIYSYSVDKVSGMPDLIGQAADYPLPGMVAFAISTSGRFLYTATAAGLVYTFAVVEETGRLHIAGPPIDATPPDYVEFSVQSIAVDPLDQFAYLMGTGTEIDTSTDPETVLVFPILEYYSINRKTGALTFMAATGDNLSQLVFSESGNYAYGAGQHTEEFSPPAGSLTIYDVDRNTGALTSKGGIGFRGWLVGLFHPIAMDPTRKFLYLTESSGFCDSQTDPRYPPIWEQTGSIIHSYLIDQTTGQLTHSGYSNNSSPEILGWGEVHPTGNFVYLLNAFDYTSVDYSPSYGGPSCSDYSRVPGTIYSYYRDSDTGELHLTGSAEAGGDSRSITLDPTGRFLYLLNQYDLYVYNIDQATGALGVIGTPLSGATETPLPGRAYSHPFTLVGF